MEPQNINFAAIPRTAISIVTRPAEFFRGMSKSGGFLEPLVFAAIMGLVAGIIQVVLGFVGLGHEAGYGLGMLGGFDAIIFMPITASIISFIGGAILFAIWRLMGSPENYETAYRCGAYLMVLSPINAIIGVVPYAGGVITMAIYLFFLVAASVHVHRIEPQKAWLVFGILCAVIALVGLFSEYKIRHMASSMNPWRQMGEDYRRDMGKSSDEMRRQAEEMAGQIKKRAEEAKKPAERD